MCWYLQEVPRGGVPKLLVPEEVPPLGVIKTIINRSGSLGRRSPEDWPPHCKGGCGGAFLGGS